MAPTPVEQRPTIGNSPVHEQQQQQQTQRAATPQCRQSNGTMSVTKAATTSAPRPVGRPGRRLASGNNPQSDCMLACASDKKSLIYFLLWFANSSAAHAVGGVPHPHPRPRRREQRPRRGRRRKQERPRTRTVLHIVYLATPTSMFTQTSAHAMSEEGSHKGESTADNGRAAVVDGDRCDGRGGA